MDILEKYNIYDRHFYEIIRDLIDSEVVRKMDNFIQHGSTSTLEHCLNVSYSSYKMALALKLDYVSTARGALLHDLYLYDWHKLPKEKHFFKQHGFVHASLALKNANKYFKLNDVEKDIIEKHMWPLTLRKLPLYRESVLVSVMDKCVSSKETLAPYVHKLTEIV